MRKKVVISMIAVLIVIVLGGVFTIYEKNKNTENSVEMKNEEKANQEIIKEQENIARVEEKLPITNNPPEEVNKNEVIEPSKVEKKSDEVNKIEKSSPIKKNVEPKVSEKVSERVNEGDYFYGDIEQEIFELVNKERQKGGLPSLTYNTTMQKYARIKSKDMGDNDYLDHADLNGKYIVDKMKQEGVSYKAWAENIAYIGGDNSNLASKFMTNWMNSEGHRNNILSPNYDSIGVGVYKVGNKYYATQEFYK